MEGLKTGDRVMVTWPHLNGILGTIVMAPIPHSAINPKELINSSIAVWIKLNEPILDKELAIRKSGYDGGNSMGEYSSQIATYLKDEHDSKNEVHFLQFHIAYIILDLDTECDKCYLNECVCKYLEDINKYS